MFCGESHLSSSGVEERLFVRGVIVSYEAVRKRCGKFDQAYAKLWALWFPFRQSCYCSPHLKRG